MAKTTSKSSEPVIRVQLTLSTLGHIPLHQQGLTKKLDAKINRYLDSGGDDEPLARQLAHFGEAATRRMITNEISSWLDDLRVAPTIEAITIID